MAAFAAWAAAAYAAHEAPDAAPDAAAAKADTVALSPLAASRPLELPLPVAPDSIMADSHTYSKEKLLDALRPLTPIQREQLTSDFTTVVPSIWKKSEAKDGAADSKESKYVLRRYVTSIRPSGFYKGKIVVSTPAMARLYVDGESVATKATLDTVPAEMTADISLEPSEDAFLEIHLLSEGEEIPAPTVSLVPDKESAGVALAQGPGLKGVFNIHSLAGGERISRASISPDGAYILMTQTYNEDGVNSDTRSYVIGRADGKIVADDVDDDSRWMDNQGATLVWPETTIRDGVTLHTFDISSKRRGILASGLPDDATNFILLPDARGVLFYCYEKAEADTGIMRRVRGLDDRNPSSRARHYLNLYRFDEKMTRPITYGGVSTYILDISPDSKKILYSTMKENPTEFPFYIQRLVEMDLATLATDTVPGIDSSMTEAIYAPDGRRILVAAGPNAFGGVGLNAGNFKWGNDFDIQLYLVDPKRGASGRIDGEGTVTPLTRDFDPSVMSGLEWNATDGRIYFRGEAGFDANLYRLDPKDGKIVRLPCDVDFIRQWSISDRHPEYIAYVGMSYDYMGRAELLDTRTGRNRVLADPNAPYMAQLNIGGSKSWSFTCPQDAYSKPDSIAAPTVVDCTVTFPPDFDASKKYPMIVYYYGGTSPSNHTNHSPYTPNNFASKGYVVLTMNPSGTTGYGQEYSARHVNAWGDRTADEIIYGTKLFCKENGFVDAEHVGCIGASYGGFMTMLLQTKTDIFAAAVAHAGISNITSYWGEGWWGYSYNSVAAARSYPWNNPKLFTENSPLFAADKIHTPLLLLHGTVDTNVPIGESIQLYNALKLLGRDVEFVMVEGSDHIVLDFEKRKEWYATIMAWFEKWLKGDSRWWDSLYKS